MKYFTIDEFTYSTTAKKYKINNTPNATQIDNITEFIETLLDPLREAWATYCQEHGLGNPALRVSSGFRCNALNRLIGGSNTSSHTAGLAVDLVPYNGKLKHFKIFCMSYLQNKDFDQFISEDEVSGVPEWIHIGFKNLYGNQRHQLLYKPKNVNKYYRL